MIINQLNGVNEMPPRSTTTSRSRSTNQSSARRVTSTARARRIGILPYGPSDSCRDLKNTLTTKLAEVAGWSVVQLRHETSAFSPRAGELVVNYGLRNNNATQLERLSNEAGATFLNKVPAVNRAANKRTAFECFQGNGVPSVEWTTDRQTAMNWNMAGSIVYARTVLNGHSGEGIVVVSPTDTMPQAPLYTRGITEQRREFRIHVMKGVITYVQQKRRRDGYRDLPEYSEQIRNHHTGWIYATSDISPNQAAISAALRAISSLGLDFGAVDVITRRDQAWVLEVNTAAGLSGTNLETFADNVIRVAQGEQPMPWNGLANVSTTTTTETTTPEAPVQNEAVQAAPVSQPVPAETPARPVAEPVQPARPQAEPVRANRQRQRGTPQNLVDGGFYVIRMVDVSASEEGSDEATRVMEVAKYHDGHFWLCGVEVEIEPAEVTVVRMVEF